MYTLYIGNEINTLVAQFISIIQFVASVLHMGIIIYHIIDHYIWVYNSCKSVTGSMYLSIYVDYIVN